MFGLPRTHLRPRNVRLDTLIRLRWLAVFGQFAAVLVVHFGLEFDVPIWACLGGDRAVGVCSIWRCACASGIRNGSSPSAPPISWASTSPSLRRCSTSPAAWKIRFVPAARPGADPATALPPRMTLLIGVFAVICATVLVFFHFPLPWDAGGADSSCRAIYVVGVWLSILLAIGYIGVYTWQIAEEARQLSDALAATELVLQREQHCRSSTVSPPPRRTSSARRSPPSPS